jgi:hypothetical protein
MAWPDSHQMKNSYKLVPSIAGNLRGVALVPRPHCHCDHRGVQSARFIVFNVLLRTEALSIDDRCYSFLDRC